MKLSVVIVSHNHEQYLQDCLSCLLKEFQSVRSEVFVIDNHSSDNSVDLIKEKFNKQVNLIENKQNLGFAKACNQGIKRAEGNYIFFLNPDTQVAKGSIRKMINFLEEYKETDCVVPKLLNLDKSLQYSIRRFPNLLMVLIRRTPLRLVPFIKSKDASHLMKDISHNQIIEIDWALASCMMVRKRVFKQIGLFDENFFVYCEDIDWFWRLKKAGLKAHYLPKAKVLHHHLAKSDKKLLSRETFYHTKSMIYFFRKYWKDILTGRYP